MHTQLKILLQKCSSRIFKNGERYSFLKWGQKAFNNFRVVPPGTGICHQVNLEYLSKVVWSTDLEVKAMLILTL